MSMHGKIHLHGLLENPDYYKVVGLCDIDEPKMKAVAEEYHLDDVPLFTDAEEMLKETRPEIFVFVTYPDLRLSVIQLAVKYGVKGISFEKPMAESLQEAKKIVKLCHDNGIKAVVCHQQTSRPSRPHHPWPGPATSVSGGKTKHRKPPRYRFPSSIHANENFH